MQALLAATDEHSWWVDTGLPILITVAVAVAATVLLRVVVGRFRHKLEQAPSPSQAGNLQRAATLAHALSNTVVVIVWTIAVLIALGYLHVNLAPLIASAGIAGVALGFGAQSVVKDGLSGFFILLENQFGVGDSVEVRTTANPVAGRVEWFTLRSTALRAYDGTLNIVPNGNIQVVSNRSRGWARAIVDARVPYGRDLEEARGILEELFDELRQEAQVKEWVMDGPTVLGVETAADGVVAIRVVAETRPQRRADVERLLRERMAQRLTEKGIV